VAEIKKVGGEDLGQRPTTGQIAVASLAGTSVEWYDFFVYATAAALVFDVLFFPEFDPLVGTLLAFSSLAVGFFARPVGGLIFGHFGDRIGRKSMLVISLLIMGAATILIGLLPTYASIGIAAAIVLTALRFLQGLALGGEMGGAVLMAVEHAPEGRRGFQGSFPQMGVPLGLILANLAFFSISGLSEDQFLSWGWRIPFLISVVLLGVGLFVRVKIMETPSFSRVAETDAVAKVPVLDLLRTNGKQVLLTCGAYLTCGVTFYVLMAFGLTYGTETLGLPRSTMLALVLISSAFMFLALPVCGALSDKVGRRPMYLAGAISMGLVAFPLFWLLNTKIFVLMLLGYLLAVLAFSLSYGPLGAFFAESFDSRVRYSGFSLGYQLGVILGGALVPIISTYLLSVFGGYWAVAVYIISMAAVSLVSVLLLTETYRSDIVGKRSAQTRDASV
jgi:metabolite-proton symporter